MSGEDKRGSERTIPFVSDEEVIVVHGEGQGHVLAKMMDLSESGTLVYLLAEGEAPDSATLSIYHQGKVFEVAAQVVRRNGRLIAFEFTDPKAEAMHEIQSKLIRMEIEWLRLSGKS